jgi:hypothetical protein
MTVEESFKGILIDKIGLILSGEHPFPPAMGKYENNDSLLLYRFLDHIKHCLSPKTGTYFYTGEIGQGNFNGGFSELVVTQFEINVALACLLCNESTCQFIMPDDTHGKNWFISCRDEISSRMEVNSTVALEWLLYNIKNDYIDMGITRCDMPPANRHDCFVKMRLSLGSFYQNIMSESWQRSC